VLPLVLCHHRCPRNVDQGLIASMQIVATIVPIFLVVLLGWCIQRRGFIPTEFLEPANRLVYYVAIPAMIFQSITKSTLRDGFHPLVIVLTLFALVAVYLLAWGIGHVISLERSQHGSFIQCAGHGNLGYIGLAVAYYYIGDKGLAQASVIAGFLMIVQNVLSVMALQFYSPSGGKAPGIGVYFGRVMANPVILSVVFGLAVSAVGLPIPLILKRTLTIVSGLALPTALLIIGASLSLDRIQEYTAPALWASAIKLVVLPGLGWGLFRLCGLGPEDALPGLILLASPTATVSYVMAKEMHGNTDLSVAAISASTLLSAVSFMVWLRMAAM
jgi:predicted permease